MHTHKRTCTHKLTHTNTHIHTDKHNLKYMHTRTNTCTCSAEKHRNIQGNTHAHREYALIGVQTLAHIYTQSLTQPLTHIHTQRYTENLRRCTEPQTLM